MIFNISVSNNRRLYRLEILHTIPSLALNGLVSRIGQRRITHRFGWFIGGSSKDCKVIHRNCKASDPKPTPDLATIFILRGNNKRFAHNYTK